MFWADVREIIAQIGFVNRVTTLKGFIYQSGVTIQYYVLLQRLKVIKC